MDFSLLSEEPTDQPNTTGLFENTQRRCGTGPRRSMTEGASMLAMTRKGALPLVTLQVTEPASAEDRRG